MDAQEIRTKRLRTRRSGLLRCHRLLNRVPIDGVELGPEPPGSATAALKPGAPDRGVVSERPRLPGPAGELGSGRPETGLPFGAAAGAAGHRLGANSEDLGSWPALRRGSPASTEHERAGRGNVSGGRIDWVKVAHARGVRWELLEVGPAPRRESAASTGLAPDGTRNVSGGRIGRVGAATARGVPSELPEAGPTHRRESAASSELDPDGTRNVSGGPIDWVKAAAARGVPSELPEVGPAHRRESAASTELDPHGTRNVSIDRAAVRVEASSVDSEVRRALHLDPVTDREDGSEHCLDTAADEPEATVPPVLATPGPRIAAAGQGATVGMTAEAGHGDHHLEGEVGHARGRAGAHARGGDLQLPTRGPDGLELHPRMDPARLRSDAGAALAAGEFARAGTLYAAYCASSPRDRQSHLRMGDAWARAGETERAIDAYLAAAQGFAEDGFLARAIAASKLVLELGPNHTRMQRVLADLYARRAAGGQALRSLLPNGAAKLSPTPPGSTAVPSVEAASSDAPAPPTSHPARSASHPTEPELPELVVTEFALEPDPSERTLEDVLAAATEAAAQRLFDPVPLSAPAALARSTPEIREAASPPAGPVGAQLERLPSSQRFLELSLEDAGEGPPLAAAATGLPDSPGEPKYIDLQLDDSPVGEPRRSRDPGPLILALEEVAGTAPADPVVARNPFVPPSPRNVPRTPLFSDLSHEAFVELVERCPLRRFGAGERILQQGERGEGFFVICEGRVSVLREEDGVARPIAVLEPGEFFGEVALLAGGPRTASVDALTDGTQVLEIAAPMLVELAKRHAGVASALKSFCRQRLLSNLLATSALFRPLERADRRELASRFRARDALPHEIILEEDRPGDGLHVVLAGQLQVLRLGERVSTLGSGDVFGEMSLLGGVSANATVQAVRRSSLLRLPGHEFAAVLERYPAVKSYLEALRDAREEINARLPLGVEDEPLLVV
jgi:CRP-like cAMP-binding protein